MNDKPRSKAESLKAALSPTDQAALPRFVLYTAGALVLSGLFSVIASLTLFAGATDKGGWLFKSSKKANDKLFGTAIKHKTGWLTDAKLQDRVDSTPKSLLITSIVVLIALTVLAVSAYRGKYWVRWTTLGLWVLATVTQTLAGIGSLLLVTSKDIDAVFKVPAFLSALFFVAAVVLVNLRPSVEFFKANKPTRAAAGTAPARRGLFAPREPAATRPAAGTKRAAATTSAGKTAEKTSLVKTTAPERPRSKARATSESAAKGAELARARAKASKSRRTGV